MKSEDQIIELLSERSHKFDVLNDRVETLNIEMKGVNKRLVRVEKGIFKLNLILAQNSRLLVKLVKTMTGSRGWKRRSSNNG